MSKADKEELEGFDSPEEEESEDFEIGGPVTAGVPAAPPSRAPRTPCGSTCARSGAFRC